MKRGSSASEASPFSEAECVFPDQPFDDAMRKTAGIFLSSLKVNVASMALALKDLNWLDTGHRAHSIKGSAWCFGFGRLAELAAELEAIAKEQTDPVEAAAILAAIQEIVPRIEAGLKSSGVALTHSHHP